MAATSDLTLPAGCSWRVATMADLVAIRALMQRAIGELQAGFLTPAQVRASHHVMGLDTQLIQDGTYFIVEHGSHLAGCGGWSFRATLYGGDDSIVARRPDRLDPAHDAAKIRAMYTDPAFTRRGIGRFIVGLCERAAEENGFRRTEMMATLAGEPLYSALGYRQVERIESSAVGGVRVPLIRMAKPLWDGTS